MSTDKAKGLFFIILLAALALMFSSFASAEIIISIISPTNMTYNTTNILVNISANCSENCSYIGYNWSNGSETIVCEEQTCNITKNVTFVDGKVITLLAWANDTAGNFNSTMVTFTVDVAGPNISLMAPSDNFATYSTKLNFVFNVSDDFSTELDCALYIDGIQKKNGSVRNNTNINWSISDLSRALHSWNVTCRDNVGNIGVSETRSFEIKEVMFCEEGETGENLKIKIKTPEPYAKFYAGDTISIKVEVENRADESLDIIIKAELYDLNEDEPLATNKSAVTIKEETEKTYTLDLRIPGNVDVTHDYIVRVKVYEEDDEEEQCREDAVNVIIKKKAHNVVINYLSVPSRVSCGEPFQIEFEIENTGSSDEDVKINLKNDTLGINVSYEISLDSGDSHKGPLDREFIVPNNTREGYYLIVLRIIYNEDKEVKKEAELEVRGNCFVERKEISFSTEQLTDGFVDREFILKVRVENTGNVAMNCSLDIYDYESWARIQKIEPSSLSLSVGSVEYFYVYLVPFEDGIKTLKLKIKYDGNVSEPKIVSVNVRKPTAPASSFEQFMFEIKRNWQYVLANVVLLIAIIVLIIALTKQKRRKTASSEIKVKSITEKELKPKKK